MGAGRIRGEREGFPSTPSGAMVIPWSHSPFSISPRSPKAAMPVKRCATRSPSPAPGGGVGYRGCWMAEHHNLPGIASAATAVALAHVGAGTSSIRIGAGGIMLPNHAPLVIAEQFGTLAPLHPGRAQLGLGRA